MIPRGERHRKPVVRRWQLPIASKTFVAVLAVILVGLSTDAWAPPPGFTPFLEKNLVVTNLTAPNAATYSAGLVGVTATIADVGHIALRGGAAVRVGF